MKQKTEHGSASPQRRADACSGIAEAYATGGSDLELFQILYFVLENTRCPHTSFSQALVAGRKLRIATGSGKLRIAQSGPARAALWREGQSHIAAGFINGLIPQWIRWGAFPALRAGVFFDFISAALA